MTYGLKTRKEILNKLDDLYLDRNALDNTISRLENRVFYKNYENS